MAVEKITKVDMFNAIADFIADTDWERKDEAIEFIEKHIGFPITMISNGPGREDIIYR